MRSTPELATGADDTGAPRPPGVVRTFLAKVRTLGLRASLRRAGAIVSAEGVAGLRDRVAAWRARARPAAIPTAVAVLRRPAAGAEATQQRGVNLIGHPFGVLGMGEHVRKSAHAFATAGVPFTLIDTFDQPGALAAKITEFPYLDRLTREPSHRVSLFHLNADEMPLASAHLGAAFFTGRYNIGYWAWELARFPDAWRGSFDFFDELWAPSRFIQQALAHASPVPVHYMPLAVGFPAREPLRRRHFGLPGDRFLFLFYFDFTSYVARKNPLAALAAFERAFPPGQRQRVGCVIKLNGMQLRPEDSAAFRAALSGRDESVFLIDKVMTDEEVRSLVQVLRQLRVAPSRGRVRARTRRGDVLRQARHRHRLFRQPRLHERRQRLSRGARAGAGARRRVSACRGPGVGGRRRGPRRRVHAAARRGSGARSRARRPRGRVHAAPITAFPAVGARYRRRLATLGFVDEPVS